MIRSIWIALWTAGRTKETKNLAERMVSWSWQPKASQWAVQCGTETTCNVNNMVDIQQTKSITFRWCAGRAFARFRNRTEAGGRMMSMATVIRDWDFGKTEFSWRIDLFCYSGCAYGSFVAASEVGEAGRRHRPNHG